MPDASSCVKDVCCAGRHHRCQRQERPSAGPRCDCGGQDGACARSCGGRSSRARAPRRGGGGERLLRNQPGRRHILPGILQLCSGNVLDAQLLPHPVLPRGMYAGPCMSPVSEYPTFVKDAGTLNLLRSDAAMCSMQAAQLPSADQVRGVPRSGLIFHLPRFQIGTVSALLCLGRCEARRSPAGGQHAVHDFPLMGKGQTELSQGMPVQSTGGSGDWASAAQTALSGLANNLNSATQQAASAQGTGEAPVVADTALSESERSLLTPTAAVPVTLGTYASTATRAGATPG